MEKMTKSLKITAAVTVIAVLAIGAMVLLNGGGANDSSQIDNNFFNEASKPAETKRPQDKTQGQLITEPEPVTGEDYQKPADPNAPIDTDLADIESDLKSLDSDSAEIEKTVQDASQL